MRWFYCAAVAALVLTQSGIVRADAPERPLRLPTELMRQFHDGDRGLSYALVGFPDGTAAVQVTAYIGASGPFGGYDVWDSWLIYLGRDGRQVREVPLPELRVRGAQVVRGLAHGGVVLMATTRGSLFMAEVAADGRLK
jgi:hypothetical protein